MDALIASGVFAVAVVICIPFGGPFNWALYALALGGQFLCTFFVEMGRNFAISSGAKTKNNLPTAAALFAVAFGWLVTGYVVLAFAIAFVVWVSLKTLSS